MIPTISRGADFRGLLNYALAPAHDPELVASNLAGRDIPSFVWELTAGIRERRTQGRPEAEQPVVHISLSFAHEDRRLTQAELSLIAETFLSRMGYGGCGYVAIEHKDRPHQHLHLVVSRVKPDGTLVWKERGDFQKAMAVARGLEAEFGLRRLDAIPTPQERRPAKDEYRYQERAGQASERARLQRLVAEAIRDRPTLGEFAARLEQDGVEIRLTRADDGPVLGISYRLGQFAFKGSALGPGYGWHALLGRGLDVDATRDRDVLHRLASRVADWPSSSGPLPPEQQQRLKRVLDQILAGSTSVEAFARALATQGVHVVLNQAHTGHVSGITYVVEGRRIKGSTLGRAYSWAAVQRRLAAPAPDPAEPGSAPPRATAGGDGGGGPKRPPTLSAHDRARLARDEARRLTPEYRQKLLQEAPEAAQIRDYGDIQPFPNITLERAELIRDALLSDVRKQFADYPAPSGLSIYPLSGYDDYRVVAGIALVWRGPDGEILGAATTHDTLKGMLAVPPDLQAVFERYNASTESAEERQRLMAWWDAHHHLFHGGDPTIAVDRDAPRELQRQAVRDMQLELARHRVEHRIAPTDPGMRSPLSPYGAAMLNAHRASLELTNAIAQAVVRNPDALIGLVRMPDTGRPLTREEILRGALDVAHAGGPQFHIEAVALKLALRPYAADPDLFARTFGFTLELLPKGIFLVREDLPSGGQELVFEDARGRRLERFNERVQGPSARREDGLGHEAALRGDTTRDLADPAGRREGRGEAAGPERGAAPEVAAAVLLERARQVLDAAATGQPTLTQFVQRAQAAGVEVRLYQRPDGTVFAVGYRLGPARVRPRDLGPTYAWRGLVQRGVSYLPARDAALLKLIGRTVDDRQRRPGRQGARPGKAAGDRRPADAATLARVAASVRAARANAPTFTTFVARLQATGVEVRLYYLDGEPIALGYRVPGTDPHAPESVSIRARELGPGNGWRRLLREGLDFDPVRDAATIASVQRELEHAPPSRLEATDQQRDDVRRAVREALAGGATFTQFVQRVEAQGIEVRAYRDPAGDVYSVGYGLPDAFVRGSELGPGHSWRRLLREGLDFDPQRDAAALRQVGETVQAAGGDRTKTPPTPAHVERVRTAIGEALAGGATFTAFVERVESKGIEVRLYHDAHGQPLAIGYGLAGVTVAAKDLGPGHSWPRLQREGLDVDPARDQHAIHKVSVAVPPREEGYVRPPATASQQEHVRQVVRESLAGGAALTEFVARVEAHGVEVRLYADGQGNVVSIGYGYQGASVAPRDLGPGHSWARLQREGLDVDPSRDGPALQKVTQALPEAAEGSRARPEPQPTHIEGVRQAVEGALAGGATFSEFVQRVEAQGVEVRLYNDGQRVLGIGYSVAGVTVSSADLGPGHSWPRLLRREDLEFDRARDLETAYKVGVSVPPGEEGRVKPTATDEQKTYVRQVVTAALGEGATLTEFVARVEARGVEVRLYEDGEGNVVSIGYGYAGVSLAPKDLGPRHSWQRLQRHGLDFDPSRDAAAAYTIGVTLPPRNEDQTRPAATDEQKQYVRQVVGQALAERPTFTEFVDRVEGRGVEVRLFGDGAGNILGIGYSLDGVTVAPKDLGPGHSWQRLQRQGLDFDAFRDDPAVYAVSTIVAQTDEPFVPRAATAEQKAWVRQVVRETLDGGATFTQFRERVEGQGVEVRLYIDAERRPLSISYGYEGVLIPGKELGPGHSWQRLLRGGLDVSVERDAAALRLVASVLPDEAAQRERPVASEVQLAATRETLREALLGRPSLQQFVERVEAQGVEVRLYTDNAGQVAAVGFGLGRVHASGRELGEGFTWPALQARGVDYEPTRDADIVRQVGYALPPPDAPTLTDAITAAHDAVQEAASVARRLKHRLDQIEAVIEDPLTGLARIAAETAVQAAVKGVSEALREAGQIATRHLEERRESEQQTRDAALLRETGSPAVPLDAPREPQAGSPGPDRSAPADTPPTASREPATPAAGVPKPDMYLEDRNHDRPSDPRPQPAREHGSRAIVEPSEARNTAPGRVGDPGVTRDQGVAHPDRVPEQARPGVPEAGRDARQAGLPGAGGPREDAPAVPGPGRRGPQPDRDHSQRAAEGTHDTAGGPRPDRGPAPGPLHGDAAARGPSSDQQREAVPAHREGERYGQRGAAAVVGRGGSLQAGDPARAALADPSPDPGAPRPHAGDRRLVVVPPATPDQPELATPRGGAAEHTAVAPAMANDSPSPSPTPGREPAERAPVPTNPPTRESVTPPSGMEQLRAAVAAFKRSIDENLRGVPDHVKDAAARAVATAAPVLGEAMRHVPRPGQVRELTESPEKMPLEVAKKATSVVAPAASPVVTTVANKISKSIDRSREPGGGGQTP